MGRVVAWPAVATAALVSWWIAGGSRPGVVTCEVVGALAAALGVVEAIRSREGRAGRLWYGGTAILALAGFLSWFFVPLAGINVAGLAAMHVGVAGMWIVTAAWALARRR